MYLGREKGKNTIRTNAGPITLTSDILSLRSSGSRAQGSVNASIEALGQAYPWNSRRDEPTWYAHDFSIKLSTLTLAGFQRAVKRMELKGSRSAGVESRSTGSPGILTGQNESQNIRNFVPYRSDALTTRNRCIPRELWDVKGGWYAT